MTTRLGEDWIPGYAKLARHPALRALPRQHACANVQVLGAAHAPFGGDHYFFRVGVMERREQGRAAAEAWLHGDEREAKAS